MQITGIKLTVTRKSFVLQKTTSIAVKNGNVKELQKIKYPIVLKPVINHYEISVSRILIRLKKLFFK